MSNKSHIKNDGFLEKLDIKVSKDRKIKTNPGLMAMELPSSVDLNFTSEDVVEGLRNFAKVSRKQYEDHCIRHGIEPITHMTQDISKLMGVIPEAIEKGNFERMYISVPGKVNLSFGVPVRSYYSDDSFLEILKEVVAMLEAPVEEDKEIF